MQLTLKQVIVQPPEAFAGAVLIRNEGRYLPSAVGRAVAVINNHQWGIINGEGDGTEAGTTTPAPLTAAGLTAVGFDVGTQTVGPNDTLIIDAKFGDQNLDDEVDGGDIGLDDLGLSYGAAHSFGWALGDVYDRGHTIAEDDIACLIAVEMAKLTVAP